MKKMILTLLMVAGLATAHDDETRNEEAAAKPLSTDEQAVVAAVQAYAAAYQAADLAAIRQQVPPDGRFSYIEGTSVDPDWDAYAGHLGAELPAFSETQYEVSDIRPEVHGGMAFATFAWAMDVVIRSEQFPGGKHPVSMRGVATAVLVKIEGNWKLRHLHSARAAAPKAAAR